MIINKGAYLTLVNLP